MTELSGRIGPPSAPVVASLAAFVALFWCQAAAWAEDRPEAVVEKAQWLARRRQAEQAQELLRRASAQHPDNELYAMARAEAYVAEKNPFWALKILGELLGRKPNSCGARALAARIHIQEANLEQAEQMLESPDCERRGDFRLRFLLLRVELAELRGDRQRARELTLLAQATAQRFEEDDQRLARLTRRYDPEREPTFAAKLDLGWGWASHGMGSVPLDLPNALPRSGQRSGSSLFGVDLEMNLRPIRSNVIRPVVEAELHLAQYVESPESGLSSRRPIIRLGAELGRGSRRLLLAYAGDWIHVDTGNGSTNDGFAYATGHRFEYRIAIDRSLYAHGALGFRQFWQGERNRTESEQGLTKSIALSDQLNLLVGGAGRVHLAEQRAYDQFGVTAHAALHIAMPNGWALRETIALSQDLFPRSAGYFGAPERERRQDTLLRLGVGVTTPELVGVRFGLTYGYVNRDSNAGQYDFTDHRGLLSVTWQTDSDRIRISRIAKPGRVPMPYPDDEAVTGAKQQVNVIEVIQKDESQRRNTSCLK